MNNKSTFRQNAIIAVLKTVPGEFVSFRALLALVYGLEGSEMERPHERPEYNTLKVLIYNLRQRGYQIESSWRSAGRGKGYRLIAEPNTAEVA